MHPPTIFRLTFLAESLRIRRKSESLASTAKSNIAPSPRHTYGVIDYLVNTIPANPSEVQDPG